MSLQPIVVAASIDLHVRLKERNVWNADADQNMKSFQQVGFINFVICSEQAIIKQDKKFQVDFASVRKHDRKKGNDLDTMDKTMRSHPLGCHFLFLCCFLA